VKTTQLSTTALRYTTSSGDMPSNPMFVSMPASVWALSASAEGIPRDELCMPNGDMPCISYGSSACGIWAAAGMQKAASVTTSVIKAA